MAMKNIPLAIMTSIKEKAALAARRAEGRGVRGVMPDAWCAMGKGGASRRLPRDLHQISGGSSSPHPLPEGVTHDARQTGRYLQLDPKPILAVEQNHPHFVGDAIRIKVNPRRSPRR